MKFNLTLDFLRGLLFCYATYQLYTLGQSFFLGISSSGGIQFLGIVAGIVSALIYLGVAFALLFTPRDYSRYVTLFFAVVLILQILAAILWSQTMPSVIPSPFNALLISQLVVGGLIILLAFLFDRWLKKRQP